MMCLENDNSPLYPWRVCGVLKRELSRSLARSLALFALFITCINVYCKRILPARFMAGKSVIRSINDVIEDVLNTYYPLRFKYDVSVSFVLFYSVKSFTTMS